MHGMSSDGLGTQSLAHPGLQGSWGPLPCSFFTSISLLLRRASRIFPKEPLRRNEPLPSWENKTNTPRQGWASKHESKVIWGIWLFFQNLFSCLLSMYWTNITPDFYLSCLHLFSNDVSLFVLLNNWYNLLILDTLGVNYMWLYTFSSYILMYVHFHKSPPQRQRFRTPFHSAPSSPSQSPRWGPLKPSRFWRRSPPPGAPSFRSSTTLLWLMASIPCERRRGRREGRDRVRERIHSKCPLG